MLADFVMKLEQLNNLLDKFTEQMHQKSLKNVRYYILNSKSLCLNIYKQEVDRHNISVETLIFVEASYNGFRGYTFLENLDEALFPEQINSIITIAESNKEAFSLKPLEISLGNSNKTELLDSQNAITELLKAEKCAYNLDSKINNLTSCELFEQIEEIILKDDNGVTIVDNTSSIACEVEAIARQDKKVQTAYSCSFGRSLDELNCEAVAKEAAKQALDTLEASSIPSGEYEIIFKNKVFAQLIGAYLLVFCADTHQRGMSLLKGKIGCKIAAECFGLLEDPALACGLMQRKFDDEGTAVSRKYLVENGVFKTVLHNNATAIEDKTISSGNGFKRKYNESAAVLASNLVVESGTASLDELLSKMGTGILITGIDGLHAGIQTASGDFSLISQGFFVENGKLSRPLNQITVGGNLFEMLPNIKEIANDSQAANTGAYVLSPSIMVGKLCIGGE